MNPTLNSRPAQVRVVALVLAVLLLAGISAAYYFGTSAQAALTPSQPAPSPLSLRSPDLQLLRPAKPWMPHQNPPEVAAHAAAAVLQKLQAEPDNSALLVEAGNIYMYNRVFPGAIGFYERALRGRDDLAVRNNYASALFYSGDDDAALRQYELILSADPRNADALFNRGIVRLRAKDDPAAAIASWKALLRAHPRHPRRAEVERLIARAARPPAAP